MTGTLDENDVRACDDCHLHGTALRIREAVAEITRLKAERDSAVEQHRMMQQQLEHRTLTLGAVVKRAEAAEAEVYRVRQAVMAEAESAADYADRLAETLTPPMFAALATKLKEECEAQHARAERAEAELKALQAAPLAQLALYAAWMQPPVPSGAEIVVEEQT